MKSSQAANPNTARLLNAKERREKNIYGRVAASCEHNTTPHILGMLKYLIQKVEDPK